MQPMPQHEIHRRFFMMCFLAAFFLTFGAPSGAEAGVPRILVVGDSWAQGIFEFGAFDKVFAAHEMAGVEVRGATTAIGGSRADQWARNHNRKTDSIGKLDSLKQALEQEPTLDIVHLSIGGNDFLRATMEEGIIEMTPAQREKVWERICKDIRALVDFILAQRPGIKVLVNDYDYLDPNVMRTKLRMHIPENITRRS